MLDGDQADQWTDDRVIKDAEPACMTLVPVVRATQWSRSRARPQPNSIFVTHLMANVAQDLEACDQLRAADASAAYTANRVRVTATGLRERQIV